MKDTRKKNQFFPHSLSKSKLMIGPMPLLFKSIPIPLSKFKIIYIYIYTHSGNSKNFFQGVPISL